MKRDWKTDFRSFYYEDAPTPVQPRILPDKTALLVIDLQNIYVKCKRSYKEIDRWSWFDRRIEGSVVPKLQTLIASCRAKGISIVYARIACLDSEGRDRSLSQKKPGFNNLFLNKDSWDSQIIEEIAPEPEEIVILKTTDSALTGTNLRLILRNMGVDLVMCAGIITEQIVSSTVKNLENQSLDVHLIEDFCSAATQEHK